MEQALNEKNHMLTNAEDLLQRVSLFAASVGIHVDKQKVPKNLMKHPNTEFKFQNLLFSVDVCSFDISFAGSKICIFDSQNFVSVYGSISCSK